MLRDGAKQAISLIIPSANDRLVEWVCGLSPPLGSGFAAQVGRLPNKRYSAWEHMEPFSMSTRPSVHMRMVAHTCTRTNTYTGTMIAVLHRCTMRWWMNVHSRHSMRDYENSWGQYPWWVTKLCWAEHHSRHLPSRSFGDNGHFINQQNLFLSNCCSWPHAFGINSSEFFLSLGLRYGNTSRISQ